MRRRQTLSISGMEISVVTDADPAIIEKSVGMVDRTIREIRLKSAGCSLTEAAVLCALDSNAERLTLQKTFKEYETQVEQDKEIIEDLRQRLESQAKDLASLKADNQVMHDILSNAASNVAQADTQITTPEAVAEKESVETNPQPEATAHRVPKSKNKNHVGSMFDLLTFDDV